MRPYVDAYTNHSSKIVHIHLKFWQSCPKVIICRNDYGYFINKYNGITTKYPMLFFCQSPPHFNLLPTCKFFDTIIDVDYRYHAFTYMSIVQHWHVSLPRLSNFTYLILLVIYKNFNRYNLWLMLIDSSSNTSITLFKSITIYCGTDNISQNIPIFKVNMENIQRIIVSPTKRCYGYE